MAYMEKNFSFAVGRRDFFIVTHVEGRAKLFACFFKARDRRKIFAFHI